MLGGKPELDTFKRGSDKVIIRDWKNWNKTTLKNHPPARVNIKKCLSFLPFNLFCRILVLASNCWLIFDHQVDLLLTLGLVAAGVTLFRSKDLFQLWWDYWLGGKSWLNTWDHCSTMQPCPGSTLEHGVLHHWVIVPPNPNPIHHAASPGVKKMLCCASLPPVPPNPPTPHVQGISPSFYQRLFLHVNCWCQWFLTFQPLSPIPPTPPVQGVYPLLWPFKHALCAAL